MYLSVTMPTHLLPTERERSRRAAEQYALHQGLRERQRQHRRARAHRLRHSTAQALTRLARAVDADRLPA